MNLEPYTAAGCERLAATILHGAIRDLRKGRDIHYCRWFLQSRRARIFFDALNIDRQAALEALGMQLSHTGASE